MSQGSPDLGDGKFRLTRVQWMICFIAVIGFAFDIYELLMLPLIVRPALVELVGTQAVPGSPEFATWVGRLFYIPAVAGGVFGLLGGWLTDTLGRRRVLTFSILLYAFAAFAAGFSTNPWQLLFFRCLVFVGVCVEFVAAVAWLAELFPNPAQREKVLGYTQAFSSIGGLMIAVANGLAVAYADSLPAIGNWLGDVADSHAPWRYTLMSGLIPAIPLIVIRPFLPESPEWAEKKAAGTLQRPNPLELFSPEYRRTTIVATIMFAMCYGAAFGALQSIPRIVPGLAEVKAEAKEAIGKLPKPDEAAPAAMALSQLQAAKKTRGKIIQSNAANVTKVQEVGGLVGRVLLAYLIVVIAGRRTVIRLFQIPGLIIMPLTFVWAANTSINYLYVGAFICGLLTVGQFSFWGNYLPTVYPVHLRGTGESFAANIGGRLIGTCFAWVTATLSTTGLVGEVGTGAERIQNARRNLAYASAIIGFGVYLVGFIASFWLPEPPPEAIAAHSGDDDGAADDGDPPIETAEAGAVASDEA